MSNTTSDASTNVIRAVSLDCAAMISSRSKRTWWRKIEKGQISKVPPDSAGRCRVPLRDALVYAKASMTEEDIEVLLKADGGNADAQDDMGQFFMQAHMPEAGLYWLNLAVKAGHANAMHVLAGCYTRGEGVDKNDQIALHWLHQAAARGHYIATEQVCGLPRAMQIKSYDLS